MAHTQHFEQHGRRLTHRVLLLAHAAPVRLAANARADGEYGALLLTLRLRRASGRVELIGSFEQVHLDIAVPGYDNLQYSTAYTCGSEATFLTQAQSAVCGSWYNDFADTRGCAARCAELPEPFDECYADIAPLARLLLRGLPLGPTQRRYEERRLGPAEAFDPQPALPLYVACVSE